MFHWKAAYLSPLLGVTRCRAGIAFDQGTAQATCHFDRRGFYFMDTCNDKLRLSKGSLFCSSSLKRSFLAVAAMMLIGGSAVDANDSVGHLAAGGLVFGRTDAIEMREEDLFLSTRESGLVTNSTIARRRTWQRLSLFRFRMLPLLRARTISSSRLRTNLPTSCSSKHWWMEYRWR